MNPRKKPNYGIEPKYILMLCVMLCLMLILFSYRFPRVFEPLRKAMNTCLVPMQKGIHVVGTQIDDISAKFDDIDALREENEQLKRELTELRDRNEMLSQDLYDMELYKQLLELDKTYPEYKKVGANIIARDTSGFYATFTIQERLQPSLLGTDGTGVAG